jgi:acylphosphatase
MAECRKCVVAGRVQDVYYRGATQQYARELGVAGHARNLPDGRVEVLACGEPAAVEALCAWLWEGPPHARVREVTCHSVELDVPSGFKTG